MLQTEMADRLRQLTFDISITVLHEYVCRRCAKSRSRAGCQSGGGSAHIRTYILRRGPAEDCFGLGLDEEDVRLLMAGFVGHVAASNCGFIRTKPTKKPVGICSNSYQARFPGCSFAVYLKFFVQDGVLIVSSFKDYDDDY